MFLCRFLDRGSPRTGVVEFPGQWGEAVRTAAVRPHRTNLHRPVAIRRVGQKPPVRRPAGVFIAGSRLGNEAVILARRLDDVNIIAPLAPLPLVGDQVPARRPGRGVRPLAVGQALDVGPRHVHDVELRVPRAVGNKSDLLAVGRKARARIHSRGISQPPHDASRPLDQIELRIASPRKRRAPDCRCPGPSWARCSSPCRLESSSTFPPSAFIR